LLNFRFFIVVSWAQKKLSHGSRNWLKKLRALQRHCTRLCFGGKNFSQQPASCPGLKNDPFKRLPPPLGNPCERIGCLDTSRGSLGSLAIKNFKELYLKRGSWFILKSRTRPVHRLVLEENNKSRHLFCGWAKLVSYQIVKSRARLMLLYARALWCMHMLSLIFAFVSKFGGGWQEHSFAQQKKTC
jgi:hypothetical protein